jgi:hypothetical protein
MTGQSIAEQQKPLTSGIEAGTTNASASTCWRDIAPHHAQAQAVKSARFAQNYRRARVGLCAEGEGLITRSRNCGCGCGKPGEQAGDGPFERSERTSTRSHSQGHRE